MGMASTRNGAVLKSLCAGSLPFFSEKQRTETHVHSARGALQAVLKLPHAKATSEYCQGFQLAAKHVAWPVLALQKQAIAHYVM